MLQHFCGNVSRHVPFIHLCALLCNACLFVRNPARKKLCVFCVSVFPNQMHSELMKPLLNASPPRQDAAELEADGAAEVFKARRRVD